MVWSMWWCSMSTPYVPPYSGLRRIATASRYSHEQVRTLLAQHEHTALDGA